MENIFITFLTKGLKKCLSWVSPTQLIVSMKIEFGVEIKFSSKLRKHCFIVSTTQHCCWGKKWSWILISIPSLWPLDDIAAIVSVFFLEGLGSYFVFIILKFQNDFARCRSFFINRLGPSVSFNLETQILQFYRIIKIHLLMFSPLNSIIPLFVNSVIWKLNL